MEKTREFFLKCSENIVYIFDQSVYYLHNGLHG